jgi:hypothetical protein
MRGRKEAAEAIDAVADIETDKTPKNARRFIR